MFSCLAFFTSACATATGAQHGTGSRSKAHNNPELPTHTVPTSAGNTTPGVTTAQSAPSVADFQSDKTATSCDQQGPDTARRQISSFFELWKQRGDHFTTFISEASSGAAPITEVRSSAPLKGTNIQWAKYFNRVHNVVHPIFADRFLASFDSWPAADPLNATELSVHFLISVDASCGNVVEVRTIETSGTPEFDVAAQLSLRAAAPFGKPPAQLASHDGRVHFSWWLHRHIDKACSTYFMRPLYWPSAT